MGTTSPLRSWIGQQRPRPDLAGAVRPARGGLPRGETNNAESPGGELDRLLATLIRVLARRDGRSLGRSPFGDADGRVLLDREVDGVRCLVVRTQASPSPLAVSLSPREIEIARMVGLGHTNKMIAEGLNISLYTVATHLRRIFAKLHVSTRAAMIGVLSNHPELLGWLGTAEKTPDT